MSDFTEAYMTSQGWIVEFKGGYWLTFSPEGITGMWYPSCPIHLKKDDALCYHLTFETCSRCGYDFISEMAALTEAYQNIHSLDGLISGRKISGLPGSDS